MMRTCHFLLTKRQSVFFSESIPVTTLTVKQKLFFKGLFLFHNGLFSIKFLFHIMLCSICCMHASMNPVTGAYKWTLLLTKRSQAEKVGIQGLWPTASFLIHLFKFLFIYLVVISTIKQFSVRTGFSSQQTFWQWLWQCDSEPTWYNTSS